MVNAHGYTRLTLDADLIVRRDDEEKACVAMTALGFIIEGSTNVATRFSHKNYTVPFVDLLWTEQETFNVFSNAVSISPDGSKTLSLSHLIAMKIHAIAQRDDHGSKDVDDIRFLLKQNSGKLAHKDYQSLVNRFASESAKEDLLKLFPAD